MHDLLQTKLIGEQKAHALEVQNCALSLLDTSNDVTKLLHVSSHPVIPHPYIFFIIILTKINSSGTLRFQNRSIFSPSRSGRCSPNRCTSSQYEQGEEPHNVSNDGEITELKHSDRSLLPS